MGWYNRQGLQVMGANAAQTTFAMLPLENGQAEHIRSFHLVSSEIPLKGILCTAWDDSSPLFDTYWKYSFFTSRLQIGFGVRISVVGNRSAGLWRPQGDVEDKREL